MIGIKEKCKGYLILAVLLCLGGASTLSGASFNQPSGLINIPVAAFDTTGDLEYGSSVGLYDNLAFEFDFKLNYSLTDSFKMGVTLVNANRAVSNVHWTFFELKDHPYPVRVAAGVSNISSKKNISTWREHTSYKANTMGHYLTASLPWERHEFHAGLARRQFDVRDSGGPSNLHSVFFGWSMTRGDRQYLAEFDGNEVNIGFTHAINPHADFHLALPGLIRLENFTPGTPQRSITFGFTLKRNLFGLYKKEYTHLKNREKEVDIMAVSLQKTTKELKDKYDRLNGYLNPELIAMSTISLELYKFSHQAFLNGNLSLAIDYLERAELIDPENVAIHNRLGSYYYLSGLTTLAIVQWQRTLEQDPYNAEVLALPSHLLREVLKRPEAFSTTEPDPSSTPTL